MASNANTPSAPVYRIHGSTLSASVFQRIITSKEGREVIVYNISLSRPYTDEHGKRKFTGNLRYADLLAASHILEQAYVYITLQKHAAETVDE